MLLHNYWYATAYGLAVAAVIAWLVIDRSHLAWPPTSTAAWAVLILDALSVMCFAIGYRRDHERD